MTIYPSARLLIGLRAPHLSPSLASTVDTSVQRRASVTDCAAKKRISAKIPFCQLYLLASSFAQTMI